MKLCWIIVFCTVFPVCRLYAQVDYASAFDSDSIAFLETALRRSKEQLAVLIRSRHQLDAQYDSMTSAIQALKTQNDPGFLDKIKLKNLLKESEELSQRLVKIDQRIALQRETSTPVVERLLTMMEEQIRRYLSMVGKSRQLDRSSKQPEEERLQAMLFEKIEYQSLFAEPLSLQLASVKVNLTDDPELILLKADFLKDQEDKLVRYTHDLDAKITRLQSEMELRDEASKFLDDIYIFDKNREFKFSSRQSTDRPSTETDEGTSTVGPLTGAIGFSPRTYSETLADNTLLVNNNALVLSDLKVTPNDDLRSILYKLKLERQLARNQASRYSRMARDLYELAKRRTRNDR